MQGKLFDIQRFSIYDGPGIRTNVFFKGCNLRCLWCHNPESQSVRNELMFYSDKCTGCGKCKEICEKAFTTECIRCGECASACHHDAKKLSGFSADSSEIIAKVLKDREYYSTSGGGVTLSGGEPLLQADFAAEILKGCRENGIHTAIETAACVDIKEFKKVLPYLDLVLFDIKCIDEELHKELTGVSNRLILENAEFLKKSDLKILFRTPVIPGYNDGEIEKIADFVNGFDYEILAYHSTGCGKYTALGRECKTRDVVAPTMEYMTALAEKYGAIYKPTGI